jgi:ribosomal protein S18 acetylase RimI-like enzyme
MVSELCRGLDRGESVIVFDSGTPCGLAWFMAEGTFGRGGFLRLLAVAPGHQRRGVGGALLEEYEAVARTRSTHAFLLVGDFNDAAQRFYSRHGYRQVGRLPRFALPDVDELIFAKPIER